MKCVAGGGDTSSSSWGSDTEDSSVADHNSVWTLTFQGADDTTTDFHDDNTDFQSSADVEQTDAVRQPSSGQPEPAWVRAWSPLSLSPSKQFTQLAPNTLQTSHSHSASGAQANNAPSETPFHSEPMSDEHKTAIIGQGQPFC